MSREDNVRIFENTMRLCETNARLKESVENSAKGQKLIPEAKEISIKNKDIYADSANVSVTQKRTFEAAGGYKGQKVAVHNFASASNPGGGVSSGAGAQEECLCRCSGLYLCLNQQDMWDGFYKPHREAQDPLHNDDIIYTPSVTVFKTDTSYPKLMPENEWYDVDVITCAAPNLRSKPSNRYNTGDGNEQINISDETLMKLHEKRLARILDVAVSEGCETVILGAFGCGAFRNDPKVVAKSADTVIEGYLHAFRNIEFAVYCPLENDRNYRIFKRGITRRGMSE